MGDPALLASSLISRLPNPSIALVAPPQWWWQSGSIVDGLLAYTHATSSSQYKDLIANTLISQVTGTNDFMTPDATGNDDQAWWALAAMSAAEYGIPAPGLPWIQIARNVFEEQKGRWDMGRCGGGLKWKIREGDNGWHYKSTISNGLFFQLAARIARFTGDADALRWAEKSYDWVVGVGLISQEFDVYDGTDDAKGSGCVDVNHDQWTYNTGTFLYGAAVLTEYTGDQKWKDRASGFLAGAKRNFVKDGRLLETKCEEYFTCNTDQVSFKATLLRWMGAAATIMPELRSEVRKVLNGAAGEIMGAWNPSLGIMEHFTALELVDASIAAEGQLGRPEGYSV
ncbi:glycoside hydrolase [Dendryphion nanum]|uniref:mannan endo-1,6-alpha-mannosidase n=1 Tax=Dendryphion nanum TaxID=256645 RepID=A0A9P9DL21_9PLEO|nr:glycoside hydrolase [Dendryphion nanum]